MTGEQVYLVEDADRGECVAVSGKNAAPHAYAAITDWLTSRFPLKEAEKM